MEIKAALLAGARQLKKAKISSASLDAEVLLSAALKKPKEFIYTYPEKRLDKIQLKKFKDLINRRARLTPLAYLTSHKEFFGLDFSVNKNVLIPRPETELIVEEIIHYVKGRESLIIADIGTGSGAMAIALKKHLPWTKILATDISPAAVSVARRNAKKHQVKIIFKIGDLLAPLKKEPISIIAANLPYLPAEVSAKAGLSAETKLDKSVLYEPKKALIGGAEGWEIYQKLFKQIKTYNLKPQAILLEIGDDQRKKMTALTKKLFPLAKIAVKKDFCGWDRLLIIIPQMKSPVT